ncbi:MAG TPA: hypothetical protein VEZ90_13880, partial [Blastocatellia bacterium]|nr:hypothetical protein [Blastocatellia bacterium]
AVKTVLPTRASRQRVVPSQRKLRIVSASFTGLPYNLNQVFFIRWFGGAELKAGSLGLATADIRQWVGLGGYLFSSGSVHGLRGCRRGWWQRL